MDTIVRSDLPACEPLCLLFDGSLEGFLTTVGTIYLTHAHQFVSRIESVREYQPSLLEREIEIETNDELALRVKRGLVLQGGNAAYLTVMRTFLSSAPNCYLHAYRLARKVFQVGRTALGLFADPQTGPALDLARKVMNEYDRALGLIRFTKARSGVFYAVYRPETRLIPLVMNHFSRRFNTQRFVIYDATHHMAGVHDGFTWLMVEADRINIPNPAATEEGIVRLWQAFYDALTIKERLNPQLMQKFMPKRYWAELFEMEPRTRLPSHDELVWRDESVKNEGPKLPQLS